MHRKRSINLRHKQTLRHPLRKEFCIRPKNHLQVNFSHSPRLCFCCLTRSHPLAGNFFSCLENPHVFCQNLPLHPPCP